MATRLIFVLVLVLAASGAFAGPPLAGAWQLDAKASDQFKDLHKQIGKFDRNHRRAEDDGDNDGASHGFAGFGPQPFVTGISLKGLDALDSNSVNIRTLGTAVVFDFGHGHRRTVNPARKMTSVSLSQYGRERDPAVQFASWENGQLIVETTRDSGLRVVEHWSVDDKGQLQARFTLHPPGLTDAITYHRVFIRATSKAG